MNQHQRRQIVFCAVTLAGGLLFGDGLVAAETSKVDFLRDIRPILAAKCMKCHGPDPATREAELRLDTANGLFGLRDDVVAVVPGEPANSALLARVTATSADERMPPPDSKLTLTANEIQLLERWIREGAPFERHWAFVAPQSPSVPNVNNTNWPRNEIDRFVLARLEEQGLQPSAVADKYTLVRRVYLDLIGLPPTIEQADAFINDTRADAYARLVDELFDSPHYGEHWGRRWLDAARFADTNGYEKDRPRSVWPYRDWVLNAINNDMPFDQFTIEQIAGDMLPEATLSQRIATGFHRNTMLNEEGGVDVEQFRFENIVERTGATGTVWLGLTVGCAQCHTHKYDPITHREFYQLFAFLNNANEPELTVPDAEVSRQRAEIQLQIEQLKDSLEQHWPLPADGTDTKSAESKAQHLEQQFAAWKLDTQKRSANWQHLRPLKTSAQNRTTLTVLDDDSVLASGDRPNNDVYVVETQPQLNNITAIRVEVLPHESLPAGGPGRATFDSGAGAKGDFLLSEVDVAVVGRDGKETPLELTNASHDYALKGRSADLVIDGIFDSGWAVGGQIGKPHAVVVQFAEPLELQPGQWLKFTLAQQYIHEMTIGRFRLSATNDALPIVASGVPEEIEQILLTPEDQRTESQQQQLRQQFLLQAPELAEQHKAIAALEKQLPEHPTALVIEERSPEHARTTKIHHRGEYAKPTETVQPGVPEMLPALPADAPLNRLTLARWLVDAKNPLTARVTMNRDWQGFFGQGIVRTTEDFGTQSSAPTHPQLLDWLATEFMARGWSRKEMHRLIVNSATYRQSSHVSAELLERDPQNILLARGPRQRVEAEMVRDIVLTACGTLTRKVGGPSVFPPQPAGVVELSYGKLNWATSTGPDRYRRGLYTFAKRTSPYAMFGLFDGPSRETCVVRRGRSNTSLQALTLLNDPVFIEAARDLAKTIVMQGPNSSADRIVEIVRRFRTRPPSAVEIQLIEDFYEHQYQRLSAGELHAAEILGDEASAQTQLDQNKWAAWTLVVRAVLNFDETITKE